MMHDLVLITLNWLFKTLGRYSSSGVGRAGGGAVFPPPAKPIGGGGPEQICGQSALQAADVRARPPIAGMARHPWALVRHPPCRVGREAP